MFAMPPAAAAQSPDTGLFAARSKVRKAARRALCPLINGKVIEIADSGDYTSLLRIIEEHLPDMNLVNMTTSLHRLAKLCSESGEARALLRHEAHQLVLRDLLSGISVALLRCELGLNDSRRQALSNIIWSLGTLKCVQLQLLQITATLAEEHLTLFKPFELVSTAWAFAKLGTLHPTAREIVAPVQRAAVTVIAGVVDKLGFRFLAMAAYALVVSGLYDQKVLSSIAGRMVPMLRRTSCSPEVLVDVALSFSSYGLRNGKMLMGIANQGLRNIKHFDAFELADLCQILSSEGVNCLAFYDACVRQCEVAAMPQMQQTTIMNAVARARTQFARLRPERCAIFVSQPQPVSNATTAFAPRGPCPPSFIPYCTADMMMADKSRGTGSTAMCGDDGISDTDSVWSACDTEWSPQGERQGPTTGQTQAVCRESFQDSAEEMMSASPSASPSAVKFNIKNTFLEVEDEDEELTAEEEAIRKRLPPALSLALASMPQKELEAVRMRYQKFNVW